MAKQVLFSILFGFLMAIQGMAQENPLENDSLLQEETILSEHDRMNTILYRAKNTATSEIEFVSIGGFRVQVYAGNHPQKAREDAMLIDKTIKEQYPEYRAYISFQAPFWRVRIGDLASYYEALLLSRELKKIFPDFENEIYVVKDPTVRILYF